MGQVISDDFVLDADVLTECDKVDTGRLIEESVILSWRPRGPVTKEEREGSKVPLQNIEIRENPDLFGLTDVAREANVVGFEDRLSPLQVREQRVA